MDGGAQLVDRRYDVFGWEYALINPLDPREVERYAGFIGEPGTRVLELACGTGRLLAELAKRGARCLGIDTSETMLRIAQRNVDALPPESRDLVELRRADMTALDLRERFHLVILADNTFRMLATRDAQVGCLRCVRNHLAPEGTLLLTVRRFDAGRYPGGKREHGWSEPLRNPDTGELVSRSGYTRLAEGAKAMESVFTYRIARGDGTVDTEVCTTRLNTLTIEDIVGLLGEVGFRSVVHKSDERWIDADRSPVVHLVCELYEG